MIVRGCETLVRFLCRMMNGFCRVWGRVCEGILGWVVEGLGFGRSFGSHKHVHFNPHAFPLQHPFTNY